MHRLWQVPTLIVLVGVAGGPLGALLGVLSPERAWGLFFSGVACALLTTIFLSGAAAFASATGKPWRSLALRGAVVPLLTVVGVIVPNMERMGGPLIHDITTDVEEDAITLATPDVASQQDEVMTREQVLALQREAYPDIAPLILDLPPEEAFQKVEEAARSMPRWDLYLRNAKKGVLMATVRSRIFQFVDEVVVRVRPSADGTGSRIDVRSRSRFGRGDLGVNAERIRAYLNEVRSRT